MELGEVIEKTATRVKVRDNGIMKISAEGELRKCRGVDSVACIVRGR